MDAIKYLFPVPDRPWSTNEDRNLNPYVRAERIRAWKEAAALGWTSHCASNNHGRSLNPALVRVGIPFSVKRRRDPHNYCGTVVKAVIDGMVRAGAWKDDTPEFVEHLSPSLHVDSRGVEGMAGIVRVDVYTKRNAYIPCIHGIGCVRSDCDGAVEVVWDA